MRLITRPMTASMIRSGGIFAGSSPRPAAAWMMARMVPNRARTMFCTLSSKCGVTAPRETSRDERRLLVRQMIARMAANQWGFIDVDDDLGL